MKEKNTESTGKIEDLKVRAKGLLQAARGIVSLPAAPLAMLHGNLRRNAENPEELRETARHEIGHMLAKLLRGQEVRGVYMLRNKSLRKLLGMPRGVTTEDSPAAMFAASAISGHIATGIFNAFYGKKGMDFNFDGMNDIQKTNFIIDILSGETAQISDRSEIDPQEHFKKSYSETAVTSDLAKGKATLESSRTLQGSARTILQTAYTELIHFFERPKMKQILEILTAKFLETDYFATFSPSLSKKIIKILEENGISEEEFEEEKKQFHVLFEEIRHSL